MYRHYYNFENRNYVGYTDWALSEFYRFKGLKNVTSGNLLSYDSAASDTARCYHWGFYTRGNDLSNSTESEAAGHGVRPTLIYWQVLAFRLLLVLVFTYGVLLITSFIAYLIPDKPGNVDEQEHREKYLTQQLVLQSVRREQRPTSGQRSASATDAGPVKRTSKQQQQLDPSAAAPPQKPSQAQDAPNSSTIGFVQPPAPGFIVA